MRPYGLPRNDDVANPDLGDLGAYGRASAVGHGRGKGGDYRSHHKNPAAKAAARRGYKRRARAEARRATRDSE